MRLKLTDAMILAGGLLACLLPAGMSVWLADQQELKAEHAQVRSYAQDAMRRTDAVADQVTTATDILVALETTDGFCGPEAQAQMRRIDLSSRYIQAIGKVAGTQMVCSSLGLAGKDLELGPVDAVQSNGTRLRVGVNLPLADGEDFIVAEHRGVATIIHKDLPIDTALDMENVSVANFSKTNGTILSRRGNIESGWIERFMRTGETYFIADGQVVSIMGSDRYEIGALAAMPASTLIGRLGHTALFLLPVSLLAGAIIAFVLIYLYRRNAALPAQIRRGLQRNEFYLAYQPSVDLRTGRWTGAEALIRWRRPDGDSIGPDVFIAVAEAHGLIGRITEKVIELVRADAQGLFHRHPDFHLSLNLAGGDLYCAKLVEVLGNLQSHSGAAEGNLIVEITERSFTDADKAAAVLNLLRAQGIHIAVDDFGTGYSNIALLQKLKLDYLKIDKSFVDSIGTEAATSQVIDHIAGMARTLGLGLVAEGVETQTQASALMDMGIHCAQGWLYARPMPFSELISGLEQGREAITETAPARPHIRAGRTTFPTGSALRSDRQRRQAVIATENA